MQSNTWIDDIVSKLYLSLPWILISLKDISFPPFTFSWQACNHELKMKRQHVQSEASSAPEQQKNSTAANSQYPCAPTAYDEVWRKYLFNFIHNVSQSGNPAALRCCLTASVTVQAASTSAPTETRIWLHQLKCQKSCWFLCPGTTELFAKSELKTTDTHTQNPFCLLTWLST